MKRSNETRMNFILEEELKEELEIFAKKRRESTALIIREALREYLRKNK